MFSQRICGLFLIVGSGFLAYIFFFKIAPILVSLLPFGNSWTPILRVGIYILVGYMGGAILPLAGLAIGCLLLFGKEERK